MVKHVREKDDYRTLSNTRTVTKDWGTDMDTLVKDVTVNSDDWRYHSSVTGSHTSVNKLSQTLDWTNKITKVNGVLTNEVYTGDGSASGETLRSNASNYRLDTFDGRIFRDAETGMFSAESVALTIGYGYSGTVIEHNNTLINYLGIVHLARDSQGNIYNAILYRPTILFPDYYVMQYHAADDEVIIYNRPVNVPTTTFDIDNGVGVAFGEPLTFPPDMFDSGIDKFLPEQEPLPYVPDGDWRDAVIPEQGIFGSALSGLKTGFKANVNGLSSAVVSTATIGMWEKVEPWPVNELDRAYGYDVAYGIANGSGHFLMTAVTCGASQWSTAGKVVQVMDFGSNLVGGGKNVYDIAENGPNFSNVTGLIINTTCAAVHVKTFTDSMKMKPNPVVQAGTKHPLRAAYEGEVKALRETYEDMVKRGVDEETLARALHQMRRDLGVKYKDLTPPDKLAEISSRNLEKYQDKLGPTIEWLRARGKSWQDIIESAMRPGGVDLKF